MRQQDHGARLGRPLRLETLEPRLALSGAGLTAQYFHNSDFTGLAETRVEAIAHRWGLGSPVPGVDADTFSVRWTGQIEPEFSEAYKFTVSADDGIRLWVDGQLLIDAWTSSSRARISPPITLVAGERCDIRVEYKEIGGGALAELSWSSASQVLELIPTERLYESPAGLFGSYSDTVGNSVSRVDSTIDFYWGQRAPAAGFDGDDFSIEWNGQLQANFSEEYIFSTISDDGVRLWIGGELVIDHWSDHTATEDVGTKWLEAGKWYDIRLEYREGQDLAEIRLRWSSPRQTEGLFETVPQDNLRAMKRATFYFKNPLGGGADPFVFYHDGYYYLTQTSGSSVSIHRARALEDIHSSTPESATALAWKPPAGTNYSHNVWAPEIHRLDGKWYIYVAADDGNNATHRMHVLERDADDPFGPFIYKGQITPPTDRWAIDGTVIEWEGSAYFVWSGWSGFTNVSQNLYIAEMSNPWTLAGDRVLLSTPQFAWERHGLPINEGPQILIHDGQLHIIYSGSGFWRHEYALGRLTYNGAGPLLDRNSWTKSPTPVFQRTSEVVGTGHASFTTSPGGAEHWIVYHAHGSPTEPARDIRIQQFTYFADGTPNFGAPLPPSESIPIPSKGPDPERPFLVGDYNADGLVDTLDYNTWKATFGDRLFPGSGADGNGNGIVDAADYSLWRDNLGAEAISIALTSSESYASQSPSLGLLQASSDASEPHERAQTSGHWARKWSHAVAVSRASVTTPEEFIDRSGRRPGPRSPLGLLNAVLDAAFAEWPGRAAAQEDLPPNGLDRDESRDRLSIFLCEELLCLAEIIGSQRLA